MSHASNANLHAAKRAKNDEFYTQLSDIENELKHYTGHFEGKRVLCNCDDPYESNFFRYFALNFNRLKLKELVATCYAGSPIAGTQLSLPGLGDKGLSRRPYVARVRTVRDATGDGAVTMDDIAELFRIGENAIEELEGDGDFRSPECLAVLDECDVVVTNPPFSLFREYMAALFEHDKKFVVIGNINAVTYKEFFPAIAADKVWIGPSIHSGDRKFLVPESYPLEASNCGIDEFGRRYIRVKGVRWFTNLDIPKRHEPLILTARYAGHEDDYPMYDNYAAINVDKVASIPEDYMGVMGVPITFLDKYCPDQFEIVNCNDFKRTGESSVEVKSQRERAQCRLSSRAGTPRSTASASTPESLSGGDDMVARPEVAGRRVYRRVFIRRA